MSYQVEQFIRILNMAAEKRGLNVEISESVQFPGFDLRFSDHTRYHFCIYRLYEKDIYDQNIYMLADKITDEAAHKIGNLVQREVYKTVGSRRGGKTWLSAISDDIKEKFDMFNASIRTSSMKNAIKDVIFNPPATIVIWTDGTKTVVKAQNDEPFDPEKGLAMAIAKKAMGNQGNYFETIKKWTGRYKVKTPKSKDVKYGVYVMGAGWIKDRKYARVDGRKVFSDYIYTNDKSEAMTWKTIIGAKKNARFIQNSEVVKL